MKQYYQRSPDDDYWDMIKRCGKPSMKCIICNKSVKELEHVDDDLAQSWWDGAIVEWVAAGYGSIHDCSEFLICICDDCVTDKLME